MPNQEIQIYNNVLEVLSEHPDYKLQSIRKACQGVLHSYKKSIWQYL